MGRRAQRVAVWVAGLAALAACESRSGADPDVCVADCVFRSCGDDGCGGSCGVCAADERCLLSRCEGAADVTPPDTAPPVVAVDADNDTVRDDVDNCVGLFNPGQEDLDGDGIGDPCDNDVDGDGYDNLADCAPTNRQVSPGARERCGDGVDNDCSGTTDEHGAWDCHDFFVDADGDGAGPSSSGVCMCAPEGDRRVRVGGDCDDEDPSVSPLAVERCDDIDNNCNLLVDEGCDDDGDGYCDAALSYVGTPAVCPLGGGDCYDYSALISPAATEVEGDGWDNDCDGVAQGDEAGAPLEPSCAGVCTGTSVDALLCAAEICYPDHLLSVAVASPTGDYVANFTTAVSRWGAATNDLAPRAGGSYTILGTGVYTAPNHDALAIPNTYGGVDDPFAPGDVMFDAVELRLILRAPAGATGFTFDYIFMSAEYEEFIGDIYNDRFYAILKAPQTTGNQKQIINFTQCRSGSAYYDFIEDGQRWCYIAINTAFSERCGFVQTNIAGTGHECASGFVLEGGSSTGWLRTSWPIQPSEQFELTFHIHDTADDVYNSHVVIDNFRWEGGVFEPGTASHH